MKNISGIHIIPILFTILCSSCPYALTQIPFSVPDTVCISDSVLITNNSREAQTYYWNFCSGNLRGEPEGENIGNQGGLLNGPVFIDVVNNNGNFYSFVTNHNNRTLIRNSFGKSMLNDPVSFNLGSFDGEIPTHVEGLQVVKENDNWYIFIVGGLAEQSRLLRLSLGNDIENNDPALTNFGPIGNLDFPVDLFLKYEDNEWFGFTINEGNNSLTRFSFPDGLSGECIGTNLGNPYGLLLYPRGLFVVRANDQWHMFISNFIENSIIRLDFGYTLSEITGGENLGGMDNLDYPFDLTILQDCENYFGFVVNEVSDNLVLMDFGNDIASTPEFRMLGNIAGLNNPHGISNVFRQGDTLYTLIANDGNSTLSRIYYPICSQATRPSSSKRNPPSFTYTEPGNYNISLVLDEGLPTQENYCKNIHAFDNPEIFIGNDTVLLEGTQIELSLDTLYPGIQWNTGETTESITINDIGDYFVMVTNEHGCAGSDTIRIEMDYGIPNFFSPNDDGYNDCWEINMLQNFPDATVSIYDRFGKLLVSYRGGDEGWDGTYGGSRVKAGTYWYLIDFHGARKPLTGHVTIIR